MKKEKGVAGLNILLSVITMIFVIGIIVMAFQLTGAKMMDATTDAAADAVINDTKNSIADVTDWFPIIITITAVVVLILLIVLIIVSLRGAGMMGGDGFGGA